MIAQDEKIVVVKCPYCGEEFQFTFFTDPEDMWDDIYEWCTIYGKRFTVEFFQSGRILITKNH